MSDRYIMRKIMFIGFGYEPFWTGGMLKYQETLMRELVEQGYQISFFCGGDYDLYMRPYIKRWSNGGFRIIELRNSPNHPHRLNLREQCNLSRLDELCFDVIKSESPDLIHLHDIRMFTASIIDLINELNIPMIKSMHNYFDICPEGERLFKKERNCLYIRDFCKCAECLISLPRMSGGLQRRIDRSLLKMSIYPFLQRVWTPLKSRVLRSDNTPYISLEELARDCEYRVDFFVERLKKIDMIHFNTTFSADIFVEYGLPREKVRVILPSLKSIDTVKSKQIRDSSLPIVFGFTGGTSVHKGFYVLMKAFEKLEQDKARLVIYGNCDERLIKPWSHLNIECRGEYKSELINEAFADIDVGLFPSIWEETFGLIGVEFINAKIPVIASDIGGTRDWLEDGVNGYLVKPANVSELADRMIDFIENPGMISTLQKKMRRWKTSKQFAMSMIDLYREACLMRGKGLSTKD